MNHLNQLFTAVRKINFLIYFLSYPMQKLILFSEILKIVLFGNYPIVH